MAGKKQGDDDGRKKTGPGQPDKDRRIGTTVTASKIGRNASTGQFTSVKKAQSQPKTHVVETIKRPTTPNPTRKK